MTRLACFVLAVAACLGPSGCDKPSADDCRQALLNMQHLLGTENLNTDATLQQEVRACRGGSKKEAVQCAIKAQTLDDLRACDFEKVPGKQTLSVPGSGPAPAGSAAVPAGSAAAPAGSATASTGSAAAPAGSATGSAR